MDGKYLLIILPVFVELMRVQLIIKQGIRNVPLNKDQISKVNSVDINFCDIISNFVLVIDEEYLK